VYARHMPELWEIAEPILREVLEEDVELRWMKGTDWGRGAVEVAPLQASRVEERSDGTRSSVKIGWARPAESLPGLPGLPNRTSPSHRILLGCQMATGVLF